MWVADVERAGPVDATTVGATVGTHVRPGGHLAHVDGGDDHVRVGRGRHGDDPFTRVGCDVQLGRAVGTETAGDGLGEAPDPVAAHLGPAAIRVVQGHRPPIGCVAGHGGEQAVRADPVVACAAAPGQLDRSPVSAATPPGRGLGEVHEEVVAEPVELGEVQEIGRRHGAHSPMSASDSHPCVCQRCRQLDCQRVEGHWATLTSRRRQPRVVTGTTQTLTAGEAAGRKVGHG